MEKRKIRDISHRPIDYFSPDRIYEWVVDRKSDLSMGPMYEGWRVKDLGWKAEKDQISKSHVRFWDLMKNNKFPYMSGEFGNALDKKMGMNKETAFKFHRLNMVKQRVIVKNLVQRLQPNAT